MRKCVAYCDPTDEKYVIRLGIAPKTNRKDFRRHVVKFPGLNAQFCHSLSTGREFIRKRRDFAVGEDRRVPNRLHFRANPKGETLYERHRQSRSVDALSGALLALSSSYFTTRATYKRT